MPQIHGVELSGRSCDLSTGQGEKASVEHRIAAGRLQRTVSLSNERWEKNNKRFILFISFKTL
jgi:hypothetical protein